MATFCSNGYRVFHVNRESAAELKGVTYTERLLDWLKAEFVAEYGV